MTGLRLHLVPKVDQVDDDFMEAVIEVGTKIQPRPPLPLEQEEPPGPHSKIISFTAYTNKLDNLPCFVPFDDKGNPKWPR